MKKCIIFLLCILISFTACNAMTFSKESQNTVLSATGEVTISIKENSMDDTSVILLIENHTSKELTYDMTYAIEKKKNDTWYSLDKDMDFTALAAILQPNAVNEFPVAWESKLSKGLYRIVKPIVTTEGIGCFGVEFSVGETK